MTTINEILNATNVADLLDEEDLIKIGSQVKTGYTIDDNSRGDLKDTLAGAMKTAKQVIEKKNEPWDDASNIKFPLIMYAAMAFAAREFPEIIKDDRVVKGHVVSSDEDAILMMRAERVSRFMSYQLLYENTEWEAEMDKLLHVLPVVGTVFKKVYYDPREAQIRTELCMPDRIVVNNNITSLEKARRVSHEMILYRNTIIEKQRSGLFCEWELDDLAADQNSDGQDIDPPFTFIEQHNFLDLDDDGYAEPYAVTIHKDSGKVFAIVPRFKKEDIEYNSKKQIQCIYPEQFYIDYHFYRSPDGSFYSMGYGQMLYPISNAIDTMMNQIVDAGTLANMISGFIARGGRLKQGDMRFVPGEFKEIDTAGQALADVIMLLPTKEPSQTLFQTMTLLIEVGKELAGLSDIMQGQAPGQNVPATTILTLVENGQKSLNAIHKRLYQSLRKEFARIFFLDKEFVTDEDYQRIIKDSTVRVKYDFDIKDRDIVPVADPSMASDTARLIKAQAVMGIQGLDIQEQNRFVLEALRIDPNQIKALIPPPPDPNAPPPPEVQKTLAETAKLHSQANHLQVDAQTKQVDAQHKILSLALQASQGKVDAAHTIAKTTKLHADTIGSLGKTQDMAVKTAAIVADKKFDALHEIHQSHFDNQIKAAQQMTKELELAHKEHKLVSDHILSTQQIRQKQQAHEQQLVQDRIMAQQQHNHEKQLADQQIEALQEAQVEGERAGGES